ncbi:MAG TPA: hypothetical protein VMQ78_02460 [Candidatus Limnocylindria bacterium]|nr:hypothetical protein [Candidatus Limnocylindria bacterium]
MSRSDAVSALRLRTGLRTGAMRAAPARLFVPADTAAGPDDTLTCLLVPRETARPLIVVLVEQLPIAMLGGLAGNFREA